jgi:hypothetical protein
MNWVAALVVFIVIGNVVTIAGCKRSSGERGSGTEGAVGAAGPAHAATPQPPPGTVGPLGADCYDTTAAAACPQDPTDPSGRRLPAHGGSCRIPVCRPCGSETTLAFRDEHGVASPGFCICVPMSDNSGRGVFSCDTTDVWKKRVR